MFEADKIEEEEMLKLFNKEKQDSRTGFIWRYEWIVLGILLITGFVCFYYTDVSCTVDNSILLLKSISKGEFFHYYDFCIGKTQTVWAPNYEILMYLVFAVWCLPLAIAHHFWGIDYLYNPFAILWVKLLLLICVLIIAWLIFKISIQLGLDKRKARLAQFLFLSSANLVIPTMMISQCDIVNLVFIVLGLYMFLQHKTWKFILCFAIAIPLKMFALFVFVPLILLDEKKIWKAIVKAACGFAILVLCKIISSPSTAYHYLVGSFSGDITQQLQSSGIVLGQGTFGIFIGCVVAVCIFAYMLHVDEEMRGRYAVYLPFVVFSVFFISFAYYPYWIVLLVPFSILTIVLNGKFLKINILLETLCGLMGFFYCAIIYTWIFSGKAANYLLLNKIAGFGLNDAKYASIYELFARYGITNYKDAFYTVFVVSIIALLLINLPRKQCKKEETFHVERGVIGVRLIAILLVLVLWAGTRLIEKDTAIFNTLNETNAAADVNLLPDGNYLCQRFKASQTGDIKEISLQFDNEAQSRINVSSVKIAVKESDTGKVIFEDEIGTSVIKNGIYYLSAGGSVEQGKVYELYLQGNNDNGQSIKPYLTESLIYSEYPVEVNGQIVYQNLYAQITIK